PYRIEKIQWEYGEEYGHVAYPRNIDDVRDTIVRLECLASEKGYPFYIEIYFRDGYYVGLIVGHELSSFWFAAPAQDSLETLQHSQLDLHFDGQKHSDEWLEYSFMADHGETPLANTLPKYQAFEAFWQFLQTNTLPSWIKLTRSEFVDRYVVDTPG
ncbi:MAG TPA: hypothetical protein VGE07_22560, partial [Herpetosiphonaceae bacterium]